MALENRSFGRQLLYLLLTLGIIAGVALVLGDWGW